MECLVSSTRFRTAAWYTVCMDGRKLARRRYEDRYVRCQVNLSRPTAARLDAMAAKSGIARGVLVRECVEAGIARVAERMRRANRNRKEP